MRILYSVMTRKKKEVSTLKVTQRFTDQKDDKAVTFLSNSPAFMPCETISANTNFFGGADLVQAGDLLGVFL